MAKTVKISNDLAEKILKVYGVPVDLVRCVSIKLCAFEIAEVDILLVGVKELEDIDFGELKENSKVTITYEKINIDK